MAHDWVLVLEKDKRTIQLVGYDWSVNSATSQLIARDKTACYELLKCNDVPAIEQKLFLRPDEGRYINMENIDDELQHNAIAFNYPVVCKPNNGTAGRGVYQCRNKEELIEKTQLLFKTYRSIAVSPFYEFEYEYRVIILDQKPLMVYRKERSETSWQHNLSHGSRARVVDLKDVPENILYLAINATQAIGITLAAADIADCKDFPRIIEINSGISFEYFARQGNQEYKIAEMVYEAIVIYSLQIGKI